MLTYAEAQQRSRLIDALGYHVDLDVSGGQDVFGSVSVVRFGCREPGAASFIELRPARLHRVMLNGQELDPGTLRGNRLRRHRRRLLAGRSGGHRGRICSALLPGAR